MLRNFKEKFQFIFIFGGILCASVIGSDAFEYYTTKPTSWKSCKIYQPEFTKCSTELTQDLLTRIINGEFPEISQKTGSLDPMKLDELVFKPDGSEAVTFQATLKDVLIKGFKKVVIKESRVSKKDFSWLTKIFLPKITMNGKYKMNGKILLLPINGAGDFFIEMQNLDIIMYARTHLYEKGDLTFYNVTDVRVQLNMSRVISNFENLLNGQNKEIEDSTNQFFNENWKELFEALRPLVTETIERILLKLLKDTFDALPASFLIDDIPTSTELYSTNNKKN